MKNLKMKLTLMFGLLLFIGVYYSNAWDNDVSIKITNNTGGGSNGGGRNIYFNYYTSLVGNVNGVWMEYCNFPTTFTPAPPVSKHSLPANIPCPSLKTKQILLSPGTSTTLGTVIGCDNNHNLGYFSDDNNNYLGDLIVSMGFQSTEGGDGVCTYGGCSSMSGAHQWAITDYNDTPDFHFAAGYLSWYSDPTITISSALDQFSSYSAGRDNGNNPFPTGSLQGTRINLPLRFDWVVDNFLNPEKVTGFTPSTPGANTNTTYTLTIKDSATVPSSDGSSVSESPIPANLTTFDKIVIFGDSLSDDHNLFYAMFGDAPRGCYYNGRFSNGINWVDQLKIKLGCPVINYAIGGAEVYRTYSMNKEIKNLWVVKFEVEGLPNVYGLQDQVTSFTQAVSPTTPSITSLSPVFSKSDKVLFIILMGGNDFHAWETGNDDSLKNACTDAKSAGNTVASSLISSLNILKTFASNYFTSNPTYLVFRLPAIDESPAFSCDSQTGSDAKDYVSAFNNYIDSNAQTNGACTYDLSKPFSQLIDNYSTYNYTLSTFNIFFTTQISSSPIVINYVPVSNIYKQYLFGSRSSTDNMYNQYNFMGFEYFDASGVAASGHYGLMQYNSKFFVKQTNEQLTPSKINDYIFADRIHPSAKTHDLISDDIILYFNNQGWLKKVTPGSLADLAIQAHGINSDGKGDTNSLNILINYANNQSQIRPDFAAPTDNIFENYKNIEAPVGYINNFNYNNPNSIP